MRVHLKNVVHSAMERGVVVGYHRITKLPKTKRNNSDVVVDTMLQSIWESLDGIIDFTDDDDEKSPDKHNHAIGFSTADAVGDTKPEHKSDEDEEEDLSLEILHRLAHRK